MPDKLLFQTYQTKNGNAQEMEKKASILAFQLQTAGYQTEVKFVPNKAYKDINGEQQGEYKVYAWMKQYNPGFCKKKEPTRPEDSRQWKIVANRQKLRQAITNDIMRGKTKKV